VKVGGVDALHAVFLNENRTRCRFLVPRTGNPGISLVFGEMWDTTVADLSFRPLQVAEKSIRAEAAEKPCFVSVPPALPTRGG
jgi:hypothetical protein